MTQIIVTIEDTIALCSKDFEDALQYACAKSADCSIIVTRNKRDFPFDDIVVLTPAEFLIKYESHQ